VALVATLVRLAGERRGWSATWWSRETGGGVPSRLGWVVGITWLALPFGFWLALRLVGRDEPPASARRAFGFALLGEGTHYDYVDAPAVRQLPLASAFLWLALVPQLLFWVGFTVIAGTLTGSAAALVARAAAARGAAPATRTLARGGV